jgi:hypothetical protein
MLRLRLASRVKLSALANLVDAPLLDVGAGARRAAAALFSIRMFHYLMRVKWKKSTPGGEVTASFLVSRFSGLGSSLT